MNMMANAASRRRAGGAAHLSRYASQPYGAHPFREVRTWQEDGGWYAEVQLTRMHPRQLAYGSTEERALAGLDARVAIWKH